MTVKVLLTAGCSFSECINYDRNHNADNQTWPIFLRNHLAVSHVSEAMGSQGNGLISRRVQYRLSQLLKQYAPDEILVGIMWTGRDRFEFYFEQPVEFTTNIDGWIENPTSVTDQDPGGWVILNPHWKHEHNAPFYRHYYNETAAQLYTIEHILNCQRYLDLTGVKYFFTQAFDSTFNDFYRANPTCDYLWQQIAWSKFLPVRSEYHWVKENCPNTDVDNFHPHPWQHEKFVQQVIVPHLINGKIIHS
jgi:hypothetical protein